MDKKQFTLSDIMQTHYQKMVLDTFNPQVFKYYTQSAWWFFEDSINENRFMEIVNLDPTSDIENNVVGKYVPYLIEYYRRHAFSYEHTYQYIPDMLRKMEEKNYTIEDLQQRSYYDVVKEILSMSEFTHKGLKVLYKDEQHMVYQINNVFAYFYVDLDRAWDVDLFANRSFYLDGYDETSWKDKIFIMNLIDTDSDEHFFISSCIYNKYGESTNIYDTDLTVECWDYLSQNHGLYSDANLIKYVENKDLGDPTSFRISDKSFYETIGLGYQRAINRTTGNTLLFKNGRYTNKYYDYIGDFSGGEDDSTCMALICDNGEYNYIGINGDVIFDDWFDKAFYHTSDGWAVVGKVGKGVNMVNHNQEVRWTEWKNYEPKSLVFEGVYLKRTNRRVYSLSAVPIVKNQIQDYRFLINVETGEPYKQLIPYISYDSIRFTLLEVHPCCLNKSGYSDHFHQDITDGRIYVKEPEVLVNNGVIKPVTDDNIDEAIVGYLFNPIINTDIPVFDYYTKKKELENEHEYSAGIIYC